MLNTKSCFVCMYLHTKIQNQSKKTKHYNITVKSWRCTIKCGEACVVMGNIEIKFPYIKEWSSENFKQKKE